MPDTAPKYHGDGLAGRLISGAPEGHDARLLIDRARAAMREDSAVMHVALDDNRTTTLQELIEFFAPEAELCVFPAWDCLPYDRVSPNTDISARRMAALSTLIQWQKDPTRTPRILLTTINAATQKVPPCSTFDFSGLHLRKNGRVDLSQLQKYLDSNGYVRTQTVRESGEYAIRGGIIDLYPSGREEPVRIDLFGDEIESLKVFDPSTQRTSADVTELSMLPVTEYFLDEASISRFRAAYRAQFGAIRDEDPLYEAVSAGRRYNGMEHWLPLFYDEMATLFDYAPKAQISLDHGAEQAIAERFAQIDDFYQARETLRQSTLAKTKKSSDVSLSGMVYRALAPDMLYLSAENWPQDIETFTPFTAENSAHVQAQKGRDFADIRALPDGNVLGALKTHLHNLKSDKKLIAAYSDGARERLKGMMSHAGIDDLKDVQSAQEIKALKIGQVGLAVLCLEHGFVAPDLAVITEQDILGDRLARRQKKKRADNFLKEVSSLDEGDLVVHADHGVGRFIGLETISAAGALHDCLKLEYHGGDKLYVPVENIEILTRFGEDEGTVQLDKLGGAGWQARKARVKKDLMIMADKLLGIAAQRQLQRTQKLDIDGAIYNEFAARFPYQETEDQDRAINDVIADMAAAHPMDRLVCGDVGFGKTEVAIRAAYIAAMAGVQVAIAVPTTLLARQHTANFVKRLSHTGIKIGQLSRMVGAKEAEEVKKGLREGHINIVIGTHALFADSVKFDNLGLLIVDEEQRFGVKQKERLKELKSNIHVLTLTATPIPRTLQMALTGVRDLSLITTPPVDRLAIRTFVMPFDPVVLREALMREHYRGGQSFYVCPRIKDIESIEETLKELVPELKVIVAHGQMAATDLEDRMSAFYDGQYDILLATNIIESGLDIPTANTMIVHHADLFGLSQLYQIRGRIGRSKVRAYAYLTYNTTKKLTVQGQKRLEVMDTLDTLGAGFQLASHDMDIRGAGNLLGDQQSGHIREIGVELYQQMLEEAVAAAREGVGFDDLQSDHWSPTINLGTDVLIPETYVPDLNVRMSLYRRLSELEDSEGVEGFAAELIDRFGDIPEEVENLLDIVKIKQLCKQAGIDKVEAGPKGAVISFYNNAPPNPEALLKWLHERRGALKLRPDQKLVAARDWPRPSLRVKGVQSLLKEMVTL